MPRYSEKRKISIHRRNANCHTDALRRPTELAAIQIHIRMPAITLVKAGKVTCIKTQNNSSNHSSA
jgi:hypothetical protein